jgi:hypothetical protein
MARSLMKKMASIWRKLDQEFDVQIERRNKMNPE